MKKLLIYILIIIVLILSFSIGYILGKNTNISAIDNYEHPIDIEEKLCIQNSDIHNYTFCSEIAIKSWEKEIQKNLDLLKQVMKKEDYKYIEEMNNEWNKSAYSQINTINRFIVNKNGVIYQTEGKNNISNIKKQYAILLKNIYSTYTD